MEFVEKKKVSQQSFTLSDVPALPLGLSLHKHFKWAFLFCVTLKYARKKKRKNKLTKPFHLRISLFLIKLVPVTGCLSFNQFQSPIDLHTEAKQKSSE